MGIFLLCFCTLILIVYFDFFHSPVKLSGKKIIINNLNGTIIKSLVIQDVQNGIWATRGYDIYFSADNGKTFIKKCRVPIPVNSIYFLGNSSLFRKIFSKSIFTEIKVLQTGTIVAFAGGKILRLGFGEKKFQIVHHLRYFGKNEGFGVFPEGIAVDANGNIYYGEYFRNPKRGNVKIFFSPDDAKTWNDFFSFAPKEIKHIHAICYDEYTDSLWVTTGDARSDVLIGYFENNSSELKIVSRGIQNQAAISLLFTKDYVYWGSDTPFLDSFIYQFDRSSNTTKKHKKLNSMAWYASRLNHSLMAISTAVVHNKSGTITDWNSSMWMSDGGEVWKKIFKFRSKKNFLIQTQIRFPKADHINDLIFSVLNTVDFSGDSFIFSLSDIGKHLLTPELPRNK